MRVVPHPLTSEFSISSPTGSFSSIVPIIKPSPERGIQRAATSMSSVPSIPLYHSFLPLQWDLQVNAQSAFPLPPSFHVRISHPSSEPTVGHRPSLASRPRLLRSPRKHQLTAHSQPGSRRLVMAGEQSRVRSSHGHTATLNLKPPVPPRQPEDLGNSLAPSGGPSRLLSPKASITSKER